MSDRVRLEFDGHLAVMTLTRAEKLNALDLEMLQAIDAACAQAEVQENLRVLILTGEGKAFCTGGDIRAWGGMEPGRFGHDWVRYGHRVFDRLAGLRLPVIAALNGAAMGGGLELAACADVRVAHPGAKLALPEAGLGMVPGWSGTQRLARRFGLQATRRMALAGEVFAGDEALRLGLVDHLADDPVAKARELATLIAARSPEATQAVKLMLAGAEGDGGAAIEALASMMVARSPDLAEGVAAFSEKRKPVFGGKT